MEMYHREILNRVRKAKARRARRHNAILRIITIAMIVSFFVVPMLGWVFPDLNPVGLLLYELIPTGWGILFTAANGPDAMDKL